MRIVYVAVGLPADREHVLKVLSSRSDLVTSSFQDGLEAYQAALETPPELIVTDDFVRTLHGLAIARLLRFHEDYKAIRFLYISSDTDAESDVKAQEAGCDIYLRRPLQDKQLLGAFNQLLGKG